MLNSTCKISSNFIYFVICVVFFLLSIHVKKASAAGYKNAIETEFVRYDLPITKIKKGTVLGTLYMKSQDIRFTSRPAIMNNSAGQISFYPTATGLTPDPGCAFSGDQTTGVGYLRYDSSGTRESVCNPSNKIYLLDGLKFDFTGETFKSLQYGILYIQKTSVPRTKLVDIVVNDPQKVISMQGKILSIFTNYFSLYTDYQKNRFSFQTLTVIPTPISFYIGKTNPAVFFPSQNSSSALLNLPVKPSGGDDSLAVGSASIDLCIYDGMALSSSRYMLKFQDPNNSTTNDFRIYTLDGRNKMDYSVTLTDPSNIPQPVNNNTPFFWENMENGGSAQSRLRYLQVPNGIQGLVPCVPSIITAKVKPVRYSSIRSGSYSGKINIFFTPSTN